MMLTSAYNDLGALGSDFSIADLDLDIEVLLNGETVSTCPFSHMYWSPAQMLAHTTVNGASVTP